MTRRKELFFSTFFLGKNVVKMKLKTNTIHSLLVLYVRVLLGGSMELLQIGSRTARIRTQNFFACINMFAFLYFHQSVHIIVLFLFWVSQPPTLHSVCPFTHTHTKKKRERRRKRRRRRRRRRANSS